MFRKFDPSNDVSTSTAVKSSVQRALKTQILERHPAITEEHLDALLPRQRHLVQYKVGPHLMLYCRHIEHDDDRSPTDEPVLFQHRDGPILPTLKLVHQYPTLEFTRVTVDAGAIPFLLGGANIMCPGLTNPGGEMPADDGEKPGLEKGAGVVIYAYVVVCECIAICLVCNARFCLLFVSQLDDIVVVLKTLNFSVKEKNTPLVLVS